MRLVCPSDEVFIVTKRDKCMKFTLNLDYLDAMTRRARKVTEIDDNIYLVKKLPVSKA